MILEFPHERLPEKQYRWDELTIGDSIRGAIDAALSECQYAVVVFSPRSVHRPWLHRELDALTHLETDGRKVVLPILHDLTQEELHAVSPLMAGRLGLSTKDNSVEHLANEITRAVRRQTSCHENSLIHA